MISCLFFLNNIYKQKKMKILNFEEFTKDKLNENIKYKSNIKL